MQPLYVSFDTADERNIEYWNQLGFVEEQPRVNISDNEQVVYLSNGSSDIHLHLHKHCDNPGVRYLCLRTDVLQGECKADEFGKYQDKVDFDGHKVRIREVPPIIPKGDWSFDG